MKEYVSHLLPRLIRFSDTLDREELFVEQTWVHIDENRNKQHYIFKRDGKLIISLEEDVQVGSWEYIPSARGLLIDRGADKVLLNETFIDRGVLLLKKDNFLEDPFLLVNSKIVADLDVEKYLNDLLLARTGRKSLLLDDGMALEYETDFLKIGNQVFLNDKPARTGTYKSEDGAVIIAVEEGLVIELKYQKKYATREGQITVTQGYPYRVTIGDEVMKLSRPAPDGVYNPIIPDQLSMQVKDGRIFKFGYGGKRSDWIWVLILLLLLILFGLSNKIF